MIARCLQIAPFKSFHIVWLGEKNVFVVPTSLPTTFLYSSRFMAPIVRAAHGGFSVSLVCPPPFKSGPLEGEEEILGCPYVSNGKEKYFI